jgi:hypothetical protein
MTGRDDDERRRRSVRLALLHGLLALAFLALFVWTQAHR